MPPKRKAATKPASAADGSVAPVAPTRTTRSKTKVVSHKPQTDPVSEDEAETSKAPSKRAKIPSATDNGKKQPSRRGRSAKATKDDGSEDEVATTKPPAKRRKTTRSGADTVTNDDDDNDKKPPSKVAKAVGVANNATSGDEDDKKPTSKRGKGAKAAKDDDKDKDQPKMVTVVQVGAAPVDPVSGKVQTHQVLSMNGEVWDAMLNQTDLTKNANKFYVLQLLHPINNNSHCVLFLRWGRVGENGQSQTKGPFASSVAVQEFKKQFRSKTGVAWEQKKGMVASKGKYTWLERDFSQDDAVDDKKPKSSANGKGKEKEEEEEPEVMAECTLSQPLQEFCKLVFNTSIIDATLTSMDYDANKLPLGKLSKATILNGFAALKTLSEVIANPARAAQLGTCEELSGRYYSIIPHNFGRQRPVTINNMVLLKKELELVDALGDMEIASKLISKNIDKDENGNIIHPYDSNFRSLNLESMDPISRETKEFNALVEYARNTHGATHNSFSVNVLNAFRVGRSGEKDQWTNKGFHNLPEGERLLLWHGSRSTNFVGILSQGLRIAPPEAPVTGYMFGKGVYFADMMSKSVNYCHTYLSDGVGVLLLCEVAAKPLYELKSANYNAGDECKAASKLATKGLGLTQPVDWQDAGEALDHPDLSGCYMPRGIPQQVQVDGAYLQYNEYIVYDTSQIRIRYLLMVKTENNY